LRLEEITTSSRAQDVPDYDNELSEVLLYHVGLLIELEEYVEALSLLDVNAKARVIVDRTAIMENRGTARVKALVTPIPRASLILHTARCLGKLGRLEDATETWRSLLEQNSDDQSYYHEYLLTKGIDLGTCMSRDGALTNG
jgi:tetratricopeptide (TPR) repeat protein